ncbi:MAG: hypothetical protein WBX38_19595 [Candidatus Sulfotelmatobacter sp.]
MRRHAFRWLGFAAGFLVLSASLWAQETSERSAPETNGEAHLGYPLDWTSRLFLMPGIDADKVLAAGDRDPRYVYNMVMRQIAIDRFRHRWHRPERGMKIDWAVSLEKGYVPANQFPAKYQFAVTAEDCTSDYVVMGLTVTSGTQANLVGINNLYTGATPKCNSGTPWVAFAYNTATQTGGQIKTSPVISPDGTKVAFIESTSSGSYFHVLLLPKTLPTPPAQNGTVLSPLTPTSCATPTTYGCMTTLAIQTSATDSNSSPWVDYNSDTAYVGADNGLLYKITPVFRGGAPALVSDPGNWPVTLAASTQTNKILTAPVVDDTAGRIFVGDGYGYLYAVSLTSPANTYAARIEVGWVYDGTTDGSGGAGTGVVDPPIALTDPANSATDQVFAFTGCSIVQGIGAAISQIGANFTSSSTLTTSNTVDLGSGSGNGDCTGGNVHGGTFDNAFWVNGSATGHMIGCGFVSGTTTKPLKPSNPRMYFFPFAGNTITSTNSSSFLVNSTVGEECSPLTEFDNGTTDRLFFGVGGTSNAYLESSTITTALTTPNCTGTPTSTCVTSPAALGGTSGIVIDNQLSNGGTNIYFSTLAAGSVNGQKCNVTGGTANPYCAVKLTQSGLQ